ncbi:hypothetical protein TNCV_2664591 [Trichonephila clavipes]|nr:hypothetical protein TNCV_2664591 [Trichonephila clavipes]
MTFWEYTFTRLVWLLTRPAHSASMPEWMGITCSNALDSMNTRLTMSSVEYSLSPVLQVSTDDVISRYLKARR